ncbi:PREDICTED: poly(A) polymerase I-like isoform X2 [Camelina sativa]|nr:PREDICTED: poly(A) polymerase I-like isoform X2 [Camelina sativa]
MKAFAYQIDVATYERVFSIYILANMIEEAVILFEFAMSGSNKPASDFPELLHKVLMTSDVVPLARLLNSFRDNGFIISPEAKQFVVLGLKNIRQSYALLTNVHEGKQYAYKDFMHLKNLLLQRKPSQQSINERIVEDNTDSASQKTIEDDVPLRKIFDSRSVGIKRSMIPTSSYIVLRTLQFKGFHSYLVGGCVRDRLMSRKPRDFDIVTTASLDQVEGLFSEASTVGKAYPICHVYIGKTLIEVSAAVPAAEAEESTSDDMAFSVVVPCSWDEVDTILYKNSQKRDFTVNSLFLDPINFKLYDFNRGIEDIKSRMIRTVIDANQSFNEDCVRILRG